MKLPKLVLGSQAAALTIILPDITGDVSWVTDLPLGVLTQMEKHNQQTPFCWATCIWPIWGKENF